jgi:cytochrome c oxidase subunit 1
VGGAAAVLFRLELMTPAADLVESETYNKLFTLHGVMMIFFFLIPSVPAVLGNFLMPMMIGARDLAFPKLNLLSWYLFAIGGAITIWVMLVGGVDTGWTFYTYAAALIMVLGTPVVAIALLLVALERGLGIGIFDPALGGDPVLFQHLFWFYSHPAVYIMVLPAMGVISEIIPCFSRRALFGYSFVAFASLGIAVFGFLVWGHHMFVAGQSVYAGLVFSLLSYLVAIPSAIKVFNWTATLYKGSIPG